MRFGGDLSNYDIPFTAETVACFKAAGWDAIIIGCQNPATARLQARLCREGGIEVVGTYVEPFRVEDAYQATVDGIAIAREFGARIVWAACEQGGVTGIDELEAIVAQTEAAGLEAGVYTGKPTWQALFGNTAEFAHLRLWFPAYWNDRSITTDVAFGGWTKVSIHQYASTPALCGRNRDYNAFLDEEDEMSAEAMARLANLENIVAANGMQLIPWADTPGEDSVLGCFPPGTAPTPRDHPDPDATALWLTGAAALEYCRIRGFSLGLGVGLVRKDLAAHIREGHPANRVTTIPGIARDGQGGDS